MAINLKALEKSGIRAWGPTIGLKLQAELSEALGDRSASHINSYNFAELKKQIEMFEEIRERASELGLNVWGNPIRKGVEHDK